MCLCGERIRFDRWRGFYISSSVDDCIQQDKQIAGEIEQEEQIHKTIGKTVECVVTAYCKENYPHICNDGESKYTSTGTIATAGRTVAVDPKYIPYGTEIEIDGVGVRIAEDCGGAIKGENRIDLLVETHQEALEWGVQKKTITILN